VSAPTPFRRAALLLPNRFPGLPSYRIPEDLGGPRPGTRLAVPFGTALVTGVLAAWDPPPPPEGTVEREAVAALDDAPFLPEALVRVLVRAAAYYFVAPGEMLRAAVPARLLTAGEAIYAATQSSVGFSPAGAREAEVLKALLALGPSRLDDLAATAGRQGLGAALKALLGAGVARIRSESLRAASAPSEKAYVGRPAPENHPGLAKSPRRRALHRHLLALGRPASVAELRPEGGTPALLRALTEAGLASVIDLEKRVDLSLHVGPAAPDRRPTPTSAQAAATAAIAGAVGRGTEASFLLDGVTGSGKTEVYLAALEAVRASGRQGILLVPEIALAPALVRRLLARFGDRVSLLHSGLSDGERAAEWERARRGEVDAVVGPRSAVFTPLPRLGLLVLDEAHDGAYKQGESPRYDARAVARVRSHEEGITLVLGSATPSMEQELAARAGRLTRLALPERPGEGDHGRVLFAPRTIEILNACFERGEQAILFLNRRGFSPSLLCRACGDDFRCANCSVARTYHRRHESLVCHYCGDAIRRPAACPACGSDVLMPIGFGTERLAERFAEAFPAVPFAVLDRDAASRRGGAAGVLADFESGRAQALLGTQMVAKGHDFPNATALAILDADALLSFPDFRAAEKTFQLVTQAAGRVGRGDKPGLVAVQTCRPGHEAIRAAVSQDHPAFAEAELRFRRAFRYPPYTHLLLALSANMDGAKASAGARAAAEALAKAPVAKDIRILGPAPAPLERLKGQWRFHVLVKAEKRDSIAEAGRLLAALPEPLKLDVDPQNLL
jgi:primosomal protein N' (replication factor Y)